MKDFTEEEIKEMPKEERKALFAKSFNYKKELLTSKFIAM